ncbi:hypothetical protein ACLMJK_007672 [Lecanora helva]
MVVVSLGDDVRTVRRKIDMEDSQFHGTWRLLNTSAQRICHEKYGYIPLKDADTLPGILALRDLHENNKDDLDSNTHAKIMQALQVGGASAWIVHNAIKRNHEKHKKGSQLPKADSQVNADRMQLVKPGPSVATKKEPQKPMWDPARDI